MIRLGKLSPIVFLALLPALTPNGQAATNATPDFKEVYESLRAHLAGVDEAELNRAAVTGLLNELGPKAAFVTTGESPAPSASTPLVTKASVFDGDLAYLRLAHVGDGLAAALRDAYQPLAASNKLAGVVLDLRFADGVDYAASVAALEFFSAKKTATLDWGQGAQETKTGSNPIAAPLVVLVNGQTHAAAETLAAMLRETGAGLLLGNPTAGHALLTQDFPVGHGALRIATATVKLNGQELSPVRPDIAVAVSAAEELVFFAEPSKVLPGTNGFAAINKTVGTNAPNRRVRLTEAALVRAHKQGLNLDEDEAGFVNQPRDNKLEIPAVKDPTLARALDLLRGLAIVRPAKP